jgi:hypothetical protein
MTIIKAADGGEWSTEIGAAPTGVDLLLLQFNTRGAATILRLGMRVWEPNPLGPETHEGERGEWRWMVDNEDDYVDDGYIAAWRRPPALPLLKAPVPEAAQ